MIVEEQVLIKKPPEAVFAFVSNVENAPRWQSAALRDYLENADGVRVGARVIHFGKVMGRTYRTEGTVTRYEPPVSFRYDGQAWGMDMAMDYRIAPAPEGAVLTLRSESTSTGIFRLIEPLLRRWTQWMFRSDLARLKRVVETESA